MAFVAEAVAVEDRGGGASEAFGLLFGDFLELLEVLVRLCRPSVFVVREEVALEVDDLGANFRVVNRDNGCERSGKRSVLC